MRWSSETILGLFVGAAAVFTGRDTMAQAIKPPLATTIGGVAVKIAPQLQSRNYTLEPKRSYEADGLYGLDYDGKTDNMRVHVREQPGKVDHVLDWSEVNQIIAYNYDDKTAVLKTVEVNLDNGVVQDAFERSGETSKEIDKTKAFAALIARFAPMAPIPSGVQAPVAKQPEAEPTGSKVKKQSAVKPAEKILSADTTITTSNGSRLTLPKDMLLTNAESMSVKSDKRADEQIYWITQQTDKHRVIVQAHAEKTGRIDWNSLEVITVHGKNAQNQRTQDQVYVDNGKASGGTSYVGTKSEPTDENVLYQKIRKDIFKIK